MRALSCDIYESKAIGNCSNGGISSRFSEILLICDDGNIIIDEANPPENTCYMETETVLGQEYTRIYPLAEPKDAGWMNGGSVVYSSDSRFPCKHPVCLFDRQETWAEYDMYSR